MSLTIIQGYPRVLIVSASGLNNKSATGITMMNLFSGWPLDNIAQIYDGPTGPDEKICADFKRVSSQDIPWFKIAKSLLVKLRHSESSNPTHSQKTFNNFTYPATTAWIDMVPIKFSGTLLQWLEAFKPEIIYSVLGNIRMMNISQQISKKFSIPIVPHFMDDWPSTRYSCGLSNFLPRKLLISQLNNIFSRAPLGLTISDAMAKEYEYRYARSFESFMNCVEVPQRVEKQKILKHVPVTFGYVGGLHLNRWQSLKQVGNSLLKIKNEGHNVELAVFAPANDIERYGSILNKNPVVRICGTLPPEKVSEALEEFDVLVHIESFDEQDRLYTRLSISTKIPQYLAAGRPILAYGPLELASCQHILKYDCGLVVGNQNISMMDETVHRLVADSDLRNHLGKKALRTALLKHNAITVRKRFREVLQNARSIYMSNY